MRFETFFSTKLLSAIIVMALAAVVVTGCKKDDDDPMPSDTTVASFQYEVSMDNFLEVTFSNFSQNADSYEWDFGDGNSSTEKDPTHVYDAPGTYTVRLTATGPDGSDDRSQDITLSDPNELLTLLAGAESKTWYLQREGVALGIGPEINDNQWWSFGGVTPLGDRPCILDDNFTFHRDGTWEFESNNTIFVDAAANGGWLGDEEGCYDEDEPGLWTASTGEDVSAFGNGGNYTYEFNPNEGTITLLGEGAYIGLSVKTAAGDNYIPITTKTYEVFNFVDGDIADSLQMSIVGDGFVWNFYLVSYEDINDLPDIPSAMPAAEFDFTTEGLTATFTNNSANATSYTWNFGDGNTSTEENPVHTYTDEGTYTVTLSAMDDMGLSDEISKDVSVSLAQFTADALSSADGKVWRLAGEGSYKVGPNPGSGEWYGGPGPDDVIIRACQMDDEFIFYDDGTFVYDTKGQVWAEGYMGGMNACMDEGDLTAPFDAYASGTHMFTATDETVTVIGTGAFIGFNLPYNGGELPGDASGTPADEITYDVIGYTKVGDDETVIIAVDVAGDGSAWWTMTITTAN